MDREVRRAKPVASIIELDVISSCAKHAVANERTVTESGKNAVIGPLVMWVLRCCNGSGRNSKLIRGTPKNRFSLALMRAKNRIA